MTSVSKLLKLSEALIEVAYVVDITRRSQNCDIHLQMLQLTMTLQCIFLKFLYGLVNCLCVIVVRRVRMFYCKQFSWNSSTPKMFVSAELNPLSNKKKSEKPPSSPHSNIHRSLVWISQRRLSQRESNTVSGVWLVTYATYGINKNCIAQCITHTRTWFVRGVSNCR